MTSFTAFTPGAGLTGRFDSRIEGRTEGRIDARSTFSDYSSLNGSHFQELKPRTTNLQESQKLQTTGDSESQSPQSDATGKVYLVGAGPGDPGLLTVKALRLLERADVVVYDALVSAPILELICPTAECIDVGKRSGRHSLPQEKTNQLLIEQVQNHGTVVRLKGGDPFIFGRGGEEMEELVAAGIEVEVVPGITAGIAAPAYVGIPLTHRQYSSSVTFVTGHEATGKYRKPVDWAAIANGAETTVIYMGVHTLPQVTEKMIEAGRSPDTAVALVRWGTRPDAEELYGTLEDIVEKVQATNFAAPAIAVIGDVVNFRHHILSLQAMGAIPPSAASEG